MTRFRHFPAIAVADNSVAAPKPKQINQGTRNMQLHRIQAATLAALLVGVTALAACGSDDTSSSTSGNNGKRQQRRQQRWRHPGGDRRRYQVHAGAARDHRPAHQRAEL
jgi:hypothetical protein